MSVAREGRELIDVSELMVEEADVAEVDVDARDDSDREEEESVSDAGLAGLKGELRGREDERLEAMEEERVEIICEVTAATKGLS